MLAPTFLGLGCRGAIYFMPYLLISIPSNACHVHLTGHVTFFRAVSWATEKSARRRPLGAFRTGVLDVRNVREPICRYSVFGTRQLKCFLCCVAASVFFYVTLETPATRAVLLRFETQINEVHSWRDRRWCSKHSHLNNFWNTLVTNVKWDLWSPKVS